MNFKNLFVGQLLFIVSVLCHQNLPVRLAGGESVQSFEFPFMTAIYHKTMSCSGAIVSEDWVLTAAHCFSISHVFGIKPSDIKVIAGLVNYIEQTQYTQIRQGTEVYIHPNYRVSQI